MALKLAQIVYYKTLHDETPLLLLDDVLSELDFARRTALLRYLETFQTQIFMTTTDLNWKAEMKTETGKVFEIEGGKKVSERDL